jgi:hypothetical protein
MRKKIWRLLKNLEKEKINTNEAYIQLCYLLLVVRFKKLYTKKVGREQLTLPTN